MIQNQVKKVVEESSYQEKESTVRKLGLGEEKCKILAENFRGCSNGVFYFRVQGKLTPNLAKTALSWLQKRHPLLQCNFAEYDSRYNQFDFSHYLSVREEDKINEVPLTVISMSGDNHWQEIFDTELNTNFSADTKYLWQAVLLNGDDIHDLIFKFSHAISDGTSLKYFIGDFLAYCADLAEGCSIPKDFKVEPILPPVEELLPKRKTKSSQHTQDENIEVSPWRYETYQPLEKRRTGWVSHVFDSETLNKLQKACDEQKVNLNSALSVAFLNVADSVLGDTNKGEVVRSLLVPIDLRLFCKPKVKPYQLGDFVDVLTLFNSVTEEDFWESARLYESNLMKEMKKYVSRNSEITYKKARVKSTLTYLLSEKDRQKEFLSGPIISYPGIFDLSESFGDFKLKNFIVSRSIFSETISICAIIYLFRDRLHCFFNYAEGLVKPESVSAIVDDFSQVIKQI